MSEPMALPVTCPTCGDEFDLLRLSPEDAREILEVTNLNPYASLSKRVTDRLKGIADVRRDDIRHESKQ